MAALNAAQDEGKIRHIGVSNFTTDLLAQARELSAAPLVTDQVEYHPLLDQEPLLRAVRAAGMALTAYSPLAKGRLVDNDMLSRIGARHGKSAVQVTLRWLIQQEQVVAIPKSSNRDHCRANFDIFDFRLSDEEMATIHGLSHPQGRVVDPGGLAPDWD
jgi:diketogulonate reductase-like aldo/keto reductase